LSLLTCLQSTDANTWFKKLYERSDVIKATANDTQSVVLYDNETFRTLDSSSLQSTFRLHHILVTDKSYVAHKFDKVALANILLESKPFRFIGVFFFFFSFFSALDKC
jgi:hypothetical protein